jgi:hypothetical protein
LPHFRRQHISFRNHVDSEQVTQLVCINFIVFVLGFTDVTRPLGQSAQFERKRNDILALIDEPR